MKRNVGLAIVGGVLLTLPFIAWWAFASGPLTFVSDKVFPEDSGIVACRAMAEDRNPVTNDDTEVGDLTPEQYLKLRHVFRDSEHLDISVPGTKLIDLSWQMSKMEGLEALSYLESFSAAYSDLVSGCANHGIVVPPLDFSETPAPGQTTSQPPKVRFNQN